MIGAGSILAEVYETKGYNKPYVWSSGLIEDGNLRIDSNELKFCSVRGKQTLARIYNIDTADVSLGDAGLLASYLLPWFTRILPSKRYKLGILPHYADADSSFIKRFIGNHDTLIIDAKWPCKKVIKSIYKCDAILSSSLHGLIVSDSLNVPNQHIILSSRLKGGSYKFYDYYSVFDEDRYMPITPKDIDDYTVAELSDKITKDYVQPNNLNTIKQNIISAFPFK
jgi:hypothetical protein